MKNRFFSLLVSAILIITLMFTSVCMVACNKDPVGPNSSATDTGSGTGGVEPKPEPKPEPQPKPTDPEDRELYTFDNLMTNVSDMYAKDLIAGSDVTALNGFLIGDVYVEVINKALTAMEGKLPAGINLSAMGVNVYRGHDGNWYRTYAEDKVQQVNSCLNGILNSKIDGSEPITIDYSLYGEKSLAYIFLDYSEPTSSYDRNWLLNMVFSSSPVLSGVAYTTLNEAKTLLKGTDAQREAIIVKNFGEVSVSSIVGSFISDEVKANKFVASTLSIKISDVNAIKTAETQADALKLLANLYKGVYLGDVFGVSETMPGYIREIHTMTLPGLFTAAAQGSLKEYVLDYAGSLTLDKIIKAYLSGDEKALAQYDVLYQEFKAVFDTTLSEIVAIASGTTTPQEFVSEALAAAYNKVKDKALYGTITVGGIVTGIEQSVILDNTGNFVGFDILGFANYLTTNYGQDLNGLTVYNNVTAGALLDAFKQAFVTASDGSQAFSATELFRILEEAFAADLDGVCDAIAGVDYATLKGMITAWLTPDADGAYDFSSICSDLFEIVYSKVLAPNGFTKEALAEYLEGVLGTIISTDNYAALIMGGLEKVSGLTAAEIDSAFEALTGKTLTAALAEVKTAVDANPETTLMAELITFAYNYKEALVNLVLSSKSADLTEIKTIIANNTVTDEQGGSTVNYLGVMCDLYTANRAELVEYVKASVSGMVNLEEINEKLGYDVVEALLFKAIDDNLSALKESPVALAVILKQYPQNAIVVAIDYLQATVTADADTVLYTFTDSNGNVFDITANEALNLLKAISDPDATDDAKGEALSALLGNAKVSTFMELIASLAQPSAPEAPVA